MPDSQSLQSRLEELRMQFARQLPERLGNIEALCRRLEREWNGTLARDLRIAVHSLAGSAGTFGFMAVGKLAKSLEAEVVRWMDEDVVPEGINWGSVHKLLASARAHVGKPIAWPEIVTVPAPMEPTEPSPAAVVDEHPLVFLVDDDQTFAADLSMQLASYGYAIKCFNDPAPMLQILETGVAPRAIIMDMVFLGGLSGASAVSRMRQNFGNSVPVIFISARGELEARLEAVRSGFEAYFTKPLNIGLLLDRLDSLTQVDEPECYRVLIVDDDEVLAETYAAVLKSEGMDVRVVNDPMQTLNVLHEFIPDLILMDIYMPGCTGTELTVAIRQDDAFVGIPVVYLSTEQARKKQLAALARGGDDFLTKPINLQELVLSVQARMRRTRVLRAFMIRDSMTGLLNHTRVKEAIDVEVSRAGRANGRLAVVMIDLDHFKQVNDTYGHAAGDKVIRALARMLKQRLRTTDVIGRYGGEEFVVALSDADASQSTLIMEKIRAAFASLIFNADHKEFQATFSAGIALFPDCSDTQQLLAQADQALYAAKEAGRNCMMMASDVTAI